MKKIFKSFILSLSCLALVLLVGCGKTTKKPTDKKTASSTIETKPTTETSSTTESKQTTATDAPHTHTWDDGVVTTPATCTEKGVKTFTCSCGETKTEEVEVLGHDLVDDALVPATCTTDGTEAGKHCSRCDYTEGGATITKLGHDYTVEVPNSAVAATCTTDGKNADMKCSRCESVETGATVTKLGHNLVDDALVPATCTADGTEAGKHCSRCDYTEGGTAITKLGHDYTIEVPNTAVAATCTADGKNADMKCSRCDSVETGSTITKLDHNFNDYEKTAEGHRPICSCGEKGELQAHSEEEILAVPATYDNAGKTAGKKCSVCGYIIKEPEDVAKLQYTLTFNLNGGMLSGGIATIKVDKGTSASELTSLVPTKTCATFAGWFMIANESEIEIPSTATVQSDMTIIAHWTENHTWGEYVYNNDQSDFASGTKTRKCSVCEITETINDPEHPSLYTNVFAAPETLLLSYQVNGGASTANLPYSADSQLRVGLINGGYEFVNNKGEARNAAANSFLATQFPTTIPMLSTMKNYKVVGTVVGLDNSSIDTGNIGFGLVFGFYNGKPICFNVQENTGFKNVIFSDGANAKTINDTEVTYTRLGTYEYAITVVNGEATIVINGKTVTTFTMPEGSIPAIGTVMRNQNARYTNLALYVLTGSTPQEDESTNIVVEETGKQNIYNVFSNSTEPCGTAKPKVSQISKGVYALVDSTGAEVTIDNFTQGDFYGSKFNTTTTLSEDITEYTVSCTVTGTGNKGSLYGIGMTFGFYKGLPMVFVIQGGNLGVFNYATGVNTALKSFGYTSGVSYSSTGTYDILIYVKDNVATFKVNNITIGTYDIPTEETFIPAIGVALRNSTAKYENFEMIVISTKEE